MYSGTGCPVAFCPGAVHFGNGIVCYFTCKLRGSDGTQSITYPIGGSHSGIFIYGGVFPYGRRERDPGGKRDTGNKRDTGDIGLSIRNPGCNHSACSHRISLAIGKQSPEHHEACGNEDAGAYQGTNPYQEAYTGGSYHTA